MDLFTSGPECYPDYDPCSSSPCQHGGSCQRMGQYNESFDCICTSLWTGYRCTDRRLACAEELERLEREANTTNGKTSVCLNGGTCLEYTDRLAFRCVCQKGWTGTICEEQEAEAAKVNCVLVWSFLHCEDRVHLRNEQLTFLSDFTVKI